ncbi:ABC-type transport auxiliary lipoprotein family protein [Siccirubricoccus sp. G192]|uniref:ABC-type transport auxiliary lipoprotein family protein n=1 Tax=Siccirubricoccus sp. G192 TaxID=2849651 RepID=UPI001C2BE566|nr:PqiC family protein [Siccirubricoccus sp. G192]
MSEPRTDGSVILVARWRVLDGAGRTTLAGERVSPVQPIAGSGDPVVVAAMSRAVEDFTGRIAAGIRRATPAHFRAGKDSSDRPNPSHGSAWRTPWGTILSRSRRDG